MKSPAQRLPFGNDRAGVFTSEAAFAESLQKLNRPVADFSFSGPHRSGRSAGVRIGDLAVTTAFATPMRGRCLVDPQLAFIIPVSGSCRIIRPDKVLEWSAGKMLVSNSYDQPAEFVNEANSIITLRPSPDKLREALLAAGNDRGPAASAVAEEVAGRLLSRGASVDTGHTWSIDYYSAIKKLTALIDDCNCDEELLTRIGTEDVVNRLLARLILEQEQGEPAAAAVANVPRSVRAVDIICDHIRSTIGSPLSIGCMEKLTGLTGRALNYAFRARFDCTPQEWQRNFLLDHARAILKDPDYTGSVKSLAYELGFSSPSSFAAFFRQRFGELPSETLAQSLRPKPQD